MFGEQFSQHARSFLIDCKTSWLQQRSGSILSDSTSKAEIIQNTISTGQTCVMQSTLDTSKLKEPLKHFEISVL